MDATARPLRVSPELGVYAEKHRVFDIVQTMLQKILLNRPKDPIQFLIDHLKSDSDEDNHHQNIVSSFLGEVSAGNEKHCLLVVLPVAAVAFTHTGMYTQLLPSM